MSRFQVEPTVAILEECFDTFYCGLSEKVIMVLAQLYIDKSQTCHKSKWIYLVKFVTQIIGYPVYIFQGWLDRTYLCVLVH